MAVYINKEKFSDRQLPTSVASEREKKINLKIEKDDLLIIDKICEKYGMSRTSLMNGLLEMVFLSQVREIGDVRLETLLLHRADCKARWQQSEAPWTHIYLADLIHGLVCNLIDTGSQDGDFANLDGYRQEDKDRFDAIVRFFENLDKEKKDEQ